MNRQNKRYTILTLGFGILMSITACTKWLDVQPVDKFTEDQVFASENGIYEALNGIYLDMAKPELYGANLSSTTLDIFGQNYNVMSLHKLEKYQQYNFDDKNVKASIDHIWTRSYVAVLNANKLLSGLDQHPGVVNATTDARIRGEAYALRAFLQFDMLRLFGPVYATDSLKTSVPYYTDSGTEVNDILPATDVIAKVLLDLEKAEQLLLGTDPIVNIGSALADGKHSYFNFRMNYYAVKALQARVHLYRGDKISALTAAKVVIDNNKKFPWIGAEILSNKTNPDRVFSKEVLFGIQSLDLYNVYRDYFSPELADRSILAPHPNRLEALFDNKNDYRYNPNWIQTNIGGKGYATFFKYAEVKPTDLAFRYLIPIIRLSEVYYIAAECTGDLAFLNIVRNNRNLVNLPATANINSELQKEYQREFYGEGQLFYYYKRKNIKSIPNPLAASGNMTMNATKYILPLPLSELNPR